MTAAQIFQSLRTLFPAPAHTLLSEVRNGTGFGVETRTADAIAISNYPSRGLWLAGVEIKLYLGDWRRELAMPEKAEAIQKYCRYWYVATPEGLVSRTDLPETWGLIEVGKRAKIVVKAPKQEPKPITISMLCSILRNFSDSYVPRSEVADMAAAQSKILEAHRSRELQILRENVADFEKQSGVNLTSWNGSWDHGNIGEAVRLAIDSGILRRNDRIRRLRSEAAGVLASCDKLLESLVTKEAAE